MQLVRRTKIVATLGPATSDPKVIKRLIEAGVNVFRLNFSHGSREMHQKNVEFIRAEAERMGNPVGILQDLQGPKIRTATFAEGKITLTEGQTFLLTCDDNSPGDQARVGVTYPGLYADVKVGDALLLDDGRLSLRVTGLRGETIETEVTLGGVLSNNKGINIPDADLSIPAITDKDMEDLLCSGLNSRLTGWRSALCEAGTTSCWRGTTWRGPGHGPNSWRRLKSLRR